MTLYLESLQINSIKVSETDHDQRLGNTIYW